MKGITVTLLDKKQTGTDPFNRPIYEDVEITVENVLVSPTSQGGEEELDPLNLTGRRAVYTLAIPKGDENIWENRKVQFFGETWLVIGKPTEGIDHLIPLQWNKKVQVESIVRQVETEEAGT